MRFINKTLPAALAGSMLAAGHAYGADAINIVSWGGAWSAAVKDAWTDPYEQETGQQFNFIDYNGGVAEIRAQSEAGNVTWDIVDMIPADLSIACDEGLLEELDYSQIAPGPDGTPGAEDWFDTHPCGGRRRGVGDGDGLQGSHFPRHEAGLGVRFLGLRPVPRQALDAQGGGGEPRMGAHRRRRCGGRRLRPAQHRGRRGPCLRQARCGEGSERVVGCRRPGPADPGRRRGPRSAPRTTGRIFNAYKKENQPLTIMWDTQVWDIGFMAIMKGAPNLEAAETFLLGEYASPRVPGPDHLPHRVRPDAQVGQRVHRSRGQGPTCPRTT